MTVGDDRRLSNAGVSSVSCVAVASTAATPPASSRWLSVTAVPVVSRMISYRALVISYGSVSGTPDGAVVG